MNKLHVTFCQEQRLDMVHHLFWLPPEDRAEAYVKVDWWIQSEKLVLFFKKSCWQTAIQEHYMQLDRKVNARNIL